MTLLSPSSPSIFDPLSSFPAQSPELSLYATGSQAMEFSAWGEGLGVGVGVLRVENRVVLLRNQLCVPVTKYLNLNKLGGKISLDSGLHNFSLYGQLAPLH